MKTNFKRLFALVLTLCLLASLMVPVAFAEDEAVAAPSANVAETYPIRLKDMAHTDPTTATGLDAFMAYTNAKGETSYKAIGLADSDLVAAYTNGTLNWKFVGTSNEAIYRSDRAWQLRLRGWAAIQLRVADAGLYALNIATDKAAYESWTNEATTWAGDVAAYIVPVADLNQAIEDGATFSTADGANDWVYPTVGEVIPNLLTDDYSVGTATMAAEDTSVTFAKQRMEAGEYVVIIQASKSDFSISEMSLLGAAYEMENVATYDMIPFDLENTDTTTWAGTVNANLLDENGALKEYVAPGTGLPSGSNWSTHTSNGTWRAYNATKYAPGMKNAGDWGAIKIQVPASGEMYLSLKTDRTDAVAPFSNTYGQAAQAVVTAFLIPADICTATSSSAKKTEIADLIADNTYSVGTRTLLSFMDTITFDKTYMEEGTYVLVFRVDSALKSRYSVAEIALDQVAGQELPESTPVTGEVATYNFELYDTTEFANFFMDANRGLSNSAFGSYEGYYVENEDLSTVLSRNYANGNLNWDVAAVNNVSFLIRGGDKDGIRIQKAAVAEGAAADSGWAAFKVNVPVGGIYTADIVSEYASNYSTDVFVLPADADIEASLTEDNKVSTVSGQNGLSFSSAFSAGENLIVFRINENTKKSTIYVSSITLSVQDAKATYTMDLLNNDAFDAIIAETTGGKLTEATAGNMRYRNYTDDAGATVRCNYNELLVSLFARGDINWTLDAIQVSDTFTTTTFGQYSLEDGSPAIRIKQEGNENDFASVRIRVENAGTYNVTVNLTCGKVQGVSAYIMKAPSNATKFASLSNTVAASAIADENLLGNSASKAGPITGTYTFESAGEYIIVFKHNNVEDSNMYLTSIEMEPVAANFVADGKGYDTFEEAAEKATESIMLLKNAEAGDVVLPAGVTLDLNGYILYASSVDVAPGAQIIDAMDGKGLIRGDIYFNEDNAQLPLYDIDADGYKLYNVVVESCATTGANSATKYWFKVNFSNEEALALAGEMFIQADMTGVVKESGEDWAAVATAKAAFTQTWIANNDSYIVVSAVGSGLSSFKLNPGVTANGVVVSGDTMYKGSAA